MNWNWEKLKQHRPSNRGGLPIQVDTFVQALKKLKLPGGPFLALAIVVILLGSTAFYTVNQDEVGIVQRFGRYIETTQPGLNFKLPLGIDTVTKVNVKSIRPRSSVLPCRKSITVIDRNPILMRAARRSC
jgi:membrane protease subunit HflK